MRFRDDSQRCSGRDSNGRRSVIGTTDTRVDDPHTAVTEEDRNLLLEQINAEDLEKRWTSDVIADRGVRPLVVKVEGEGSDGDQVTSLSRCHEVGCDATVSGDRVWRET